VFSKAAMIFPDPGSFSGEYAIVVIVSGVVVVGMSCLSAEFVFPERRHGSEM